MPQHPAELAEPVPVDADPPLLDPRQRTSSKQQSGVGGLPAAPSVLRIIGMVGLFQVGILLARFFRAKALALTLGPDGVGLQSVIDQIMLTASLMFTASLPFAAVKFLSFAHSDGERAFTRLYRVFRRAVLGLSMVGTVIGIGLLLFWPQLFGAELAHHRVLLLIALLAVPAYNLIQLTVSALAATQRVRPSAAYQFAQWASVAVFSAIGVLLAGLIGFYIGSGVAFVLVAVGGMAYLRRKHAGSPSHASGADADKLSVRKELRRHPGVGRFSAVQSVLTISTPAAYLVARFTVLHQGGLAQAGLFAAAFTTAQSLTDSLNPANSLFLTPAMNRREEPRVKLVEAQQFRDGLIVAFVLLALPAVLFPKLVLDIVFASSFGGASSYLYVFVLAEGLLMLGGVQQALLIGLDDFGSNVAIVLAGQAVLTVLSILLVPRFGVEGVAVALLFDYGLVVVLSGWRLWQRHGMSVLGGIQIVPLAALALLAAVGALVPTLSATSPSIFAAKLATGCVVGAAVLVHARRSGALRRVVPAGG